MNRSSRILLFAMVVAAVLIAGVPAWCETPEKVSYPGHYSGYSPELYDGWELSSQYVEVRDGTLLAVDIFRPTLNEEVVEEPLPVVWMHSPYNRRYFYYQDQQVGLAAEQYPGFALNLVKYGYIVAIADFRGIYASFGSGVAYNRGEWVEPGFWDAYDLTEWFAEQLWSDGNVGMWGCSATGGSQLQAASSKPPHLKAIFPMSCELDAYTIFVRGGISAAQENAVPPPPSWLSFDSQAVPVDEDTDGSMLAAAQEEHLDGVDVGYVPYRDSISEWIAYHTGTDVEWWVDTSAFNYMDQLEASGIAMYNAANWDEVHKHGPFFRFNNLSNPARLLVGPYGHCIWSATKTNNDFDIVSEEHRFFDYWLKGVDNGIMSEPPVYYFIYNGIDNNEWRSAWQWPLPNEKRIKYYLGPTSSEPETSGINNGTLHTDPPETAGEDDYLVDYDITPENRAEKGLTYTTSPLTADMELTGHPVIHLWVSSTATDGDFIAYIEDVAPDGSSSSPFINGSLRASHRALHDAPYDTLGLPYHRSHADDMLPLTPGEPTELVFDIWPISYIFKADHRIRLTLTCVEPGKTPRLNPAPTVSIHHGPEHQSYVEFPTVAPVLPVHVRLKNKVLKVSNRNKFSAVVTFPKSLNRGYLKDIDPQAIQCNGATAQSVKLVGRKLIAVFNASDVTDLKAGKVELTVSGKIGGKYYYGPLVFEGSDSVIAYIPEK